MMSVFVLLFYFREVYYLYDITINIYIYIYMSETESGIKNIHSLRIRVEEDAGERGDEEACTNKSYTGGKSKSTIHTHIIHIYIYIYMIDVEYPQCCRRDHHRDVSFSVRRIIIIHVYIYIYI
jgi:hypothetical protein